jgi:hypothetical protein
LVTIGQLPAQQPLVITAPAPVDLNITLVDNPEQAFAIDPECAWEPVLLGSEYSCQTQVTFTPHRETTYAGSVSIRGGADKDAHVVRLSGIGVPLPLDYQTAIDFGSVVVGTPTSVEFVIFSNRPAHLDFAVLNDASGAFIAGPSCEIGPTEGGGYECTVTVTFKPPVQAAFTATLEIYTGEPEPRPVELTGNAYELT